ncbi:MAG: hypothetical protein KatS3mg068_1938 [Candidatus Sericytochromatia bacterium]|nr:MAG: hypothetical protein KatS3mg068_1938 [Candidatus Sericytochromatia bacterium]
MGSYIPAVLRGISAVQTIMAGAYESRIHTVNRFLVPRAQFAGDTAVTLTDGSYNTRTITNIPKYTTAQLANPSNTAKASGTGTIGKLSQGKPLVIKVKRDPFTGEIGVKERRDPTDPTSPIVTKDYAVFNADGTFPGAPDSNPYDPNFDPWNYNDGTTNGARYRVNTATGEIYVNNTRNFIELVNPSGLVDFGSIGSPGTRDEITGNVASMKGTDMVVGIVQFDTLQGGAATAEQQRASELSGIIQSLTSIVRSLNDAKRASLNIIR